MEQLAKQDCLRFVVKAGRDTLQPPSPPVWQGVVWRLPLSTDTMLNFVDPRVAIHYFVLVLVSFVGVLQIAATYYQLKTLLLISTGRQPWIGIFIGLFLISGALAWFIAATPGMLRPGPAGFEISLLFITAALLALFICRLTVALLRR